MEFVEACIYTHFPTYSGYNLNLCCMYFPVQPKRESHDENEMAVNTRYFETYVLCKSYQLCFHLSY